MGYRGSVNAPLGLIIGTTGKVGFFVSGRINPDYLTQVTSDYTISGEMIDLYNDPGYYIFNSNLMKHYFSVTAGVSIPLSWNFHMYAEGGYSTYDLYWGIDRYLYPAVPNGNDWVKNTKESFSGAEAGLGLMATFNRFYLSAGISSPGFSYVGINFSGGVIF
ncbi:MAG: hypothetical protein HC906_12090 [Bacteroidales bacterium]|nr:hypothetical protein [Bacteroidales bacterium]